MNPGKAITYWNISPQAKIKPVPIGIFNETYRVRTSRGNLILQKLHPLISKINPTKNYVTITKFLGSRGYPAQQILPATNGKFLVKDGRRAWRLLKETPGAVYNEIHGIKLAYEAGRELGKTHKLLKNFSMPLKGALPMFQYGKVLKKLKYHKQKLFQSSNIAVDKAAKLLLEQFPKYFLPANLPKRVIHTDPKISNFVFDKRGRAIAMIDFDTVQRLSPLYDIGDALRSLCGGKEDDLKNKFNLKRHGAFLRGYFKTARGYLSALEKKLIPQATALTILGLAARFLNDYLDDFYFGWDPKKYKSRKEHNLARAMGQIALYNNFVEKVNRG